MSKKLSESKKTSYNIAPTKCPICSKKLTSQSFIKHFQQELGKIEIRETRSSLYICNPDDKKTKPIQIELKTTEAIKLESKKSAYQAVRQLRQSKRLKRSENDAPIRYSENSDNEETEEIPPSKEKIASTSTTATATDTDTNTARATASISTSKIRAPAPLPKCPVCLETLNCDDLQMNAHIDECLYHANNDNEESPSDNEDGDESYEEYTWAGQTRVRTTSLDVYNLGGVEGYLSAKKLNPEQECDDLDVDESNEASKFGKSQFSENDIEKFLNSKNNANECQPSTSNPHSSASESDTPSLPARELENREKQLLSPVSNTQAPDANTKQPVKLKSIHPPHSQLVIDSLKSQIRQLQSREVHSCIICQESFDDPLTSINCWHVYCRDCWMSSLSSKKLCPQCQTITYPADLRRIYL